MYLPRTIRGGEPVREAKLPRNSTPSIPASQPEEQKLYRPDLPAGEQLFGIDDSDPPSPASQQDSTPTSYIGAIPSLPQSPFVDQDYIAPYQITFQQTLALSISNTTPYQTTFLRALVLSISKRCHHYPGYSQFFESAQRSGNHNLNISEQRTLQQTGAVQPLITPVPARPRSLLEHRLFRIRGRTDASVRYMPIPVIERRMPMPSSSFLAQK